MKKSLLVVLLVLVMFVGGCNTKGKSPASKIKIEKYNFSSISITGENSGWAIGENRVYRTTDGCKHWRDVSPQNTSEIYSYYFLDSNNAWVLSSNRILYRTKDGGNNWKSEKVPFNSAIFFFMLYGNDYKGWALKDYGMASGDEPVDVYKFENDSWALICKGEMPQVQSQNKGTIPWAGEKTGFVFLPDAKTGFVTIQYRAIDKYGLYITKDGGYTWAKGELPIPEKNVEILMKVPKVFTRGTSSTIILPVCLEEKENTNTAIFFATMDKGNTWYKETSLKVKGRIINIDILNKSCYFVLTENKLYGTNNGNSWTELSYPKNAVQVQFVNVKVGYALIKSGVNTNILYTDDGGHSWKNL